MGGRCGRCGQDHDPGGPCATSLVRAIVAGALAADEVRPQAAEVPSSSDEGETLPAGMTIGVHYTVIGRLGVGGMGTVYEVAHSALQKRFALKVIRKSLASDASAVQRFEREARAASAAQHENIISITDSGRTPDGGPYLVMERLYGEDLARRLRRQALRHEEADGSAWLPEWEVREIVPQILRALARAHEAGVVHRDLKPANIYLAEGDGRTIVKLVDFGISQFSTATTASRTATGIVVGTPLYMAPEQAEGKRVDHRADLYAFGMIAYQMLFGRLPSVGTALGRQDLPAAVSEVIVRCLRPSPEDRYATAREALGAWESAWAQAETGRTGGGDRTPGGVDVPSPYRPRAHGKVALAAIVSLVAVAAGTAAVATLWNDGTGQDGSSVLPAGVRKTAQPPPDAATEAPGRSKSVPPETSGAIGDASAATPEVAGGPELRISSRPTGADVKVEGRLLGKTPLVIPFPRGRPWIDITVGKRQFVPQTRRVLATDAHVEVDLKRVRRQLPIPPHP